MAFLVTQPGKLHMVSSVVDRKLSDNKHKVYATCRTGLALQIPIFMTDFDGWRAKIRDEIFIITSSTSLQKGIAPVQI